MKQDEYQPLSWKEPVPSDALISLPNGEPRCYWGGQEVSLEEWERLSLEQSQRNSAARKEREFEHAHDAFAYAATLSDGVVLDWGRCYAAMEREGLSIGFVMEPCDQPIVTAEDLQTRPGPCYILVRRDAIPGLMGGCCTNFSDSSKSWSEDFCAVIKDGTGQYESGELLHIRVSPDFRARPSVGSNWRMKLINPSDVIAVLPRHS